MSKGHYGRIVRVVRVERREIPFGDFGLSASVRVEILECGHEQRPRQDCFGETNAVRRRCRKCVA